MAESVKQGAIMDWQNKCQQFADLVATHIRLLQLVEDEENVDVTFIVRGSYVLFSTFLWDSAALLWAGLSAFMWGE
jgi:hypothetical protein